VLLNWLLVRREEELGSQAKLASSVAVALIVWQGAVGWLTVRMDNEHWSVALHLGSALAFMLSLIWLWLAAARDRGEQPEWATFDPVLAARWRNRLAWISAATLFTLFSGAFVSTTAGANTSCGVNGLYDSWPLCHGEFLPSIHDWVLQSQVIHRWLVVAVEVALLAASYIIWKEKEGGQCGSTLCKLIWGATGLYLVNIGIGASYILSWDMTDGYLEYLSLVHLMLASLTFLVLATAWLGSMIALNERGS
jgi:heme A synthase